MLKKKLPIIISLITVLNIGIYFTATYLESPDRVFAECARNSGRTSAAINLILLVFIGLFGLKKIYRDKVKLGVFQSLILSFTMNHLIHFFFVYQNFSGQKMKLGILEKLHGAITFVCIILVPFIILTSKKLTNILYFFILLHLFNVTYFISISFYARYKPGEDEAYLHRLGILTMILMLFYVVFRVYRERLVNKG